MQNKNSKIVTDKADTTQKGPPIKDTVADHPAETAGHHQGEADIQTAQADTAHTAVCRYRCSPTPYHIDSITT